VFVELCCLSFVLEESREGFDPPQHRGEGPPALPCLWRCLPPLPPPPPPPHVAAAEPELPLLLLKCINCHLIALSPGCSPAVGGLQPHVVTSLSPSPCLQSAFSLDCASFSAVVLCHPLPSCSSPWPRAQPGWCCRFPKHSVCHRAGGAPRLGYI